MDFESRLVEEISKVYADASVSITDVRKTNYSYRGIIIRPEGGKIAPTIDITDIRKQYEEDGKSFEWVVSQITNTYEVGLASVPEVPDLNKSFVLANVVYHMVNRERNFEIMGKSPCQEFDDLLLVPYINIKGDGEQCAMLSNELADSLEISEEELEAAIKENMTPVLKTMRETIIEIMVSEGMDPNLAETMCDNTGNMYIISNESKFYGAACIHYGDTMDRIAKVFDDNVLVLPSSVHECILIPAGKMTREDAVEMVKSVNSEVVNKKDFLSNNVYEYDRELKKFIQPEIVQVI